MWTLRRASNPIKNHASSIRILRVGCSRAEIISGTPDKTEISKPSNALFDRYLPSNKFYCSTCCAFLMCSTWKHNFSSQAGEEDDLEDGVSKTENVDELISEPEFSMDDETLEDLALQNSLEATDGAEKGSDEKKTMKKNAFAALLKTILGVPFHNSIHPILDKFEHKDLTREELTTVMNNLRKRRVFSKALQLSEWWEKCKRVDFVESDYANRVTLISRLRGLQAAEDYIETIPKPFKGEVVYQAHLANCAAAKNVKKAVEMFNKMKDLGFPISCYACNQLLHLYKVVDTKRIGSVLLLMEKENIKPSASTYRILIDVKGQSCDITGMEQIIESMKTEGIELDLETRSIIANHYILSGLKDKAEAILKEIEENAITGENHLASQRLIVLYAALGKADEVRRIWKLYESRARLDLDFCMAAIEAWGKLQNVSEAEEVFSKMRKGWKLLSRHYCGLLKVYADNKKLSKGKDLVKQMAESGCLIGPITWDLLVRLYLEAGDVGKADSILQKAAAQHDSVRPLISSYMAVMGQYARKGDVHNTEKMLHRMKVAGYVPRHRQFETLIEAYVNGKAPAYGIRDRMKADNVYPNRALSGQLPLVDAFRKTVASDLFD